MYAVDCLILHEDKDILSKYNTAQKYFQLINRLRRLYFNYVSSSAPACTRSLKFPLALPAGCSERHLSANMLDAGKGDGFCPPPPLQDFTVCLPNKSNGSNALEPLFKDGCTLAINHDCFL